MATARVHLTAAQIAALPMGMVVDTPGPRHGDVVTSTAVSNTDERSSSHGMSALARAGQQVIGTPSAQQRQAVAHSVSVPQQLTAVEKDGIRASVGIASDEEICASFSPGKKGLVEAFLCELSAGGVAEAKGGDEMDAAFVAKLKAQYRYSPDASGVDPLIALAKGKGAEYIPEHDKVMAIRNPSRRPRPEAKNDETAQLIQMGWHRMMHQAYLEARGAWKTVPDTPEAYAKIMKKLDVLREMGVIVAGFEEWKEIGDIRQIADLDLDAVRNFLKENNIDPKKVSVTITLVPGEIKQGLGLRHASELAEHIIANAKPGTRLKPAQQAVKSYFDACDRFAELKAVTPDLDEEEYFDSVFDAHLGQLYDEWQEYQGHGVLSWLSGELSGKPNFERPENVGLEGDLAEVESWGGFFSRLSIDQYLVRHYCNVATLTPTQFDEEKICLQSGIGNVVASPCFVLRVIDAENTLCSDRFDSPTILQVISSCVTSPKGVVPDHSVVTVQSVRDSAGTSHRVCVQYKDESGFPTMKLIKAQATHESEPTVRFKVF